MSTLVALIRILETLISAFQYISGAISAEEHNAKLRSIQAAVDKAKTGALKDRLDGGHDVEDNFNNHT